MGHTGQGLDSLEVGADALLDDNGAARLAATVLEGEGLALGDVELAVEELRRLGRGEGHKGGESGKGVLHVGGLAGVVNR